MLMLTGYNTEILWWRTPGWLIGFRWNSVCWHISEKYFKSRNAMPKITTVFYLCAYVHWINATRSFLSSTKYIFIFHSSFLEALVIPAFWKHINKCLKFRQSSTHTGYFSCWEEQQLQNVWKKIIFNFDVRMKTEWSWVDHTLKWLKVTVFFLSGFPFVHCMH